MPPMGLIGIVVPPRDDSIKNFNFEFGHFPQHKSDEQLHFVLAADVTISEKKRNGFESHLMFRSGAFKSQLLGQSVVGWAHANCVFSSLRSAVSDLKHSEADTKNELVGVKQEVATLKSEVDAMEQKVAILSSGADAMEQKVAILSSGADAMAQKVAILSSGADAMEQKVAILSSEVDAMAQKVEQRVTSMEQKLTWLTWILRSLFGIVLVLAFFPSSRNVF